MCAYGYLLIKNFPVQPLALQKLFFYKLLGLVLAILAIQQLVPSILVYSLLELTALLLGSGGKLLWHAWSRPRDIVLRLSMSCFGCSIIVAGMGLGLTSYFAYADQVAIGLWGWAGIWLWIPWLSTIVPLIRNRASIVRL